MNYTFDFSVLVAALSLCMAFLGIAPALILVAAIVPI